jgi:hypothetical protein
LQFIKWTTVTQGVAFADENNTFTTFPMPATHVMVIAHYVSYPVNINGGTGGGNYVPGETVTINACEPKNATVFKEWTTTTHDVIFANPNTPITTFIMPNSPVDITAVFETIIYYYSVTVNGGEADGDEFEAGETVAITAHDPAEGMQFKEWTTESEGVIFADANDPNTTFVMPANDVTVTANYETLNINELENKLSVYPNPTTGQIRINGQQLIGDIQIFDTAGKMCYQISQQENDGTNTFDISHLPSGIYFLKFNNETVKVVKK